MSRHGSGSRPCFMSRCSRSASGTDKHRQCLAPFTPASEPWGEEVLFSRDTFFAWRGRDLCVYACAFVFILSWPCTVKQFVFLCFACHPELVFAFLGKVDIRSLKNVGRCQRCCLGVCVLYCSDRSIDRYLASSLWSNVYYTSICTSTTALH